MHALAAYFQALQRNHASGGAVRETSHYSALENLLNAAGERLTPAVRAVAQVRDTGAGKPDFGLYALTQCERGELETLPAQKPARGVVEVKGWEADLAAVVASAQVQRYAAHYGRVLVTNYRAFVLVGRDGVLLERFVLADSAAAFLALLRQPVARELEERLLDFLARALLHNTPLTDPQEVAWFLASYAREAKSRMEAKATLSGLGLLREALEQALGMRFQGEDGEHFFRATLVQTLFYGVFSAWVLAARAGRAAGFDWRTAAWNLHVPMIAGLFAQLATPQHLQPLGLDEVLDWAGEALRRVEREAFFRRFDEEHAVQYFYEPFLKAYDPELRKQLGVWYTPPEIVRYQVARVDAVLREELGLAEGLADPQVVVLDPCCGTGAYLVEVVRCIEATLSAGGADALTAVRLKQAVLTRVFGFELLPAPFVVAHLQMGLLLQRYGAPLDTAAERVGVFLTNALTGWEPPDEKKKTLPIPFPEFQEERDRAEAVKQQKKILVVLGNPPYNGYAGVAMEEERALSEDYRTTRNKNLPAPRGQGLNDLYVRFFRMAERRIVEMSGRGVVCFISNYSWLDGLSFTGMRERYLEVFDKVWVDNLHGNRLISEYAPDGRTSETIFAMGSNSPGIKIGTAITLMVRSNKNNQKVMLYRDMQQARAAERREALLASLDDANFDAQYQTLKPEIALGLPFKVRHLDTSYLDWPLLPELFPASFPGVKTSRDEALTDIDRAELESRMRQYFDPTVSDERIREIAPALMKDGGRFQAKATRSTLCKRGFLPEKIVRYCYRPFDMRWLYWEPEGKLLDEKRPDYFAQVFSENIWIEARQKQPMEKFDRGYFVRVLADNFGNGLSSFFPLYLRSFDEQIPNLTESAKVYLQRLHADAAELFFHVLAILHAPAYRTENAGGLRQDWPRIPLPADRDTLQTSAELGRQVAALLDTETPLPSAINKQFKHIAVITRVGGGSLNPQAGDLALTAGWGHAGKNGVTMPGRGRLEQHSAAVDVYLNKNAYWANIPQPVWDYTLGGYQVIKKWLSYREKTLLGRDLMLEEIEYVSHMTRRIAALIALQPDLDAHYATVKHRETAPRG